MCFLFNILINCHEEKYLLKEILLKLYRISPQLLKTFESFVLLGRVRVIEMETLDLLLSVVGE